MTELHQSLRNIELSIQNLEKKRLEAKQTLVCLQQNQQRVAERVDHIERELRILNEMRSGAMQTNLPLPMKKRKWKHASGNSDSSSSGDDSNGAFADRVADVSADQRPLKRLRASDDAPVPESANSTESAPSGGVQTGTTPNANSSPPQQQQQQQHNYSNLNGTLPQQQQQQQQQQQYAPHSFLPQVNGDSSGMTLNNGHHENTSYQGAPYHIGPNRQAYTTATSGQMDTSSFSFNNLPAQYAAASNILGAAQYASTNNMNTAPAAQQNGGAHGPASQQYQNQQHPAAQHHDLNSLVEDGSSKRLPALLSNIPCSTICHAYPIPTTIELIEGFNYDDIGVQPGGKRNSAKDTLPQQVIELKGYFKENMSCKVEVLGLIKKVNRMEVIGFLDKQQFVQTADNRYLAMFNNCCCRFSSHSYGQKLALRFTLLDEEKEVCFVDSKCFQTITRRGREKQNKKMAQKGGWTAAEIANLLEGVKRFGHNSFAQVHKSYDWQVWQTTSILQKKYLQLVASTPSLSKD